MDLFHPTSSFSPGIRLFSTARPGTEVSISSDRWEKRVGCSALQRLPELSSEVFTILGMGNQSMEDALVYPIRSGESFREVVFRMIAHPLECLSGGLAQGVSYSGMV